LRLNFLDEEEKGRGSFGYLRRRTVEKQMKIDAEGEKVNGS